MMQHRFRSHQFFFPADPLEPAGTDEAGEVDDVDGLVDDEVSC